ncbi:DUF3037 domain-containing protein [Pedomonas mirosovicensis]|uniref:DUF3037 domain-containing protein n=1 Tax=Pedomonas mirosovicensis TaxID=2908641 RepID=UPI0021670012|nr:DUF3037 domain-containing protein [Pedomonas mirosovicensis]MCH8684991.1 DUF3037 domain-containing protein [Pedomonas mirosovicensis]
MVNVFKYCIIRFRPFVETEEFANIGIIVLNFETGELGHHLAPTRFGRVMQFFEEMEAGLYSSVVRGLDDILCTVEDLAKESPSNGKDIFEHLTTRQEAAVIYSQPRAIRAEGNVQDVAKRLFYRYVKRQFDDAANREDVLTKRIRKWLNDANIKGFKSGRIEDELLPVNFSLISKERGVHVIQPLSFADKPSVRIIDHAAKWHDRIQLLLDRRKLEEGRVLLTLEPPSDKAEESNRHAYRIATKGLRGLPVRILEKGCDPEIEQQIVEFARRGAKAQSNWLLH